MKCTLFSCCHLRRLILFEVPDVADFGGFDTEIPLRFFQGSEADSRARRHIIHLG